MALNTKLIRTSLLSLLLSTEEENQIKSNGVDHEEPVDGTHTEHVNVSGDADC